MSVVIDTNVVVDYLYARDTDSLSPLQTRAVSLFTALEVGLHAGILPEVVIHECYLVTVLRSQRLSPRDFCGVFDEILSWPCWLMDSFEIGIYGRALDYLDQYPKLEFSDAVIAARAEAYGAELATLQKSRKM